MSKIRKGDLVAVLAGKDRGKQGKVQRIVDGTHALVEKINVVKRHKKARRAGEKAGIQEQEAPLHLSKLALVSPTTGKPVRVGYQMVDDGKGGQKKVRVVRKTGEVIETQA
jgi:large subunit ribosomal protein L24